MRLTLEDLLPEDRRCDRRGRVTEADLAALETARGGDATEEEAQLQAPCAGEEPGERACRSGPRGRAPVRLTPLPGALRPCVGGRLCAGV